jgi:hypothetical protein
LDKFPEALSKSAKDFIQIVYPQIQNWFKKGKLVEVQAVTNSEMSILLDQLAGIDAWYIETNKGIRGLASRVQYEGNYQTFTVRKERETGARTEFEKLKYAINNNCVYPYWFCQAYLKYGQIQSVALCKTVDLINYIEQGKEWKDYVILTASKFGRSTFFAVSWQKFAEKGYFIKTIPERVTLQTLCYLEVKD